MSVDLMVDSMEDLVPVCAEEVAPDLDEVLFDEPAYWGCRYFS